MKNNINFPREHRLVANAEFKSLFNKSKKFIQQYLVILYKPNKKPYARLGLIVGKRVAKFAVSRNKIRRILRESFRAHQTQLGYIDVVIIARKDCNTLSKEKLREVIDQIWTKLKHS